MISGRRTHRTLRCRKHAVDARSERGKVGDVEHDASLTDRAIIVQARSLDDLLELSQRAADRLDPTDPLTMALRGAIGQTRADLIVDPG